MPSPFKGTEVSLDVLLAAEFGPETRRFIRVPLAGNTLTLTLLSHGNSLANPAFMVCLDGTIGGEAAQMYVSHKLIDACVDSVERGLSNAALAPKLKAMITEAALAEPLDNLEELLQTRIELGSVDVMPRKPADWVPPVLAFNASLAGGAPHETFVALPEKALRRVMALWSGRVDGDEGLDPMLTIAIRVGLARISHDELDQLAVDDVVTFDESPLYSKRACLLVNERLAAQGRIDGKRLALTEPIARVTGTENAALSTVNLYGPEGAPGNGRGGVTIVADVVRRQLTISQLLRTELDGPIDLPRGLDDGVDLFAGETLIGSGRIVRVGEALGLRLHKVSHDG